MNRGSSICKPAPKLVLLACASMLVYACNPDAKGRCESSNDCAQSGTYCNLQDHLCEADNFCSSVTCDAGFSCALGSCVAPGQAAIRIEAAQNALISPSADIVQVAISADSSVVLGALSVSATALDGGLFASGMVAQGSPDAGVQLTMFAADAQGPANLLATLSYTNGTDAGLIATADAVPVRVDAVAPALSAPSIESSPDEVNGWFPGNADGGIFIDLVADDTSQGSGPDGGTIVVTSCASNPACNVQGVLEGSIADGAATYRFALPRDLAPGAEGPLAYSIDVVDNAGNHADGAGSVMIDDKAPVTDSQIAVVTTGTIGEDGETWFPAGTGGVDVEITLGASDNGVGLDPSSFLMTLNASDIDSGQSPLVTGFLTTPADGKVHFKLPTGRASNREGPLRFVITLADKLGHAAAPVSGQILIDDLGPAVSLAQVDYSDATISPKRSEVCAATVTCGRGPSASPDHALRDDLVTATFSVLDCGVGADTGALPSVALTFNGAQTDFIYGSTAAGAGANNLCANGSSNQQYSFTVQIDLGADAPDLSTDTTGAAQVLLEQVAFDRIGGESFSPAPVTTDPSAGGIIEVTRVRWQAALGGRATGAPALVPLAASATASTARRLVVPVDGAANSAKPDGLEMFDGTGAVLAEVQLTSNDGGTYDRATGDVAVGASGSLWVSGTPSSSTTLWVARRPDTTATVAPCPAQLGAIGSLALQDATDAGTDIAIAGIADGGITGTTAVSFDATSSGTLSCARSSSTAPALSIVFAGTSGLSLAQGQLFVASASGFYSTTLDASGVFGSGLDQIDFTDSSGSNPIPALPAAPSFFVPTTASAGNPYFAAVNSLSSPNKQGLREAFSSTCAAILAAGLRANPDGLTTTVCWAPVETAWSDVAISDAPVLHTPVFDSSWVYTVDQNGTLQVSALAPGNNSVTAVTAGALALPSGDRSPDSGNNNQLVSPPVLLAGQSGSSGSSALLVQANGLVTLSSLTPHGNGDAAPNLSLSAQLKVGSFASSALPPTPVVDTRGSGSVAYVIDGACTGTSTASCGNAATVWAFQLDAPPVAASPQIWPRPGHDSCNSREAEGSCP